MNLTRLAIRQPIYERGLENEQGSTFDSGGAEADRGASGGSEAFLYVSSTRGRFAPAGAADRTAHQLFLVLDGVTTMR